MVWVGFGYGVIGRGASPQGHGMRGYPSQDKRGVPAVRAAAGQCSILNCIIAINILYDASKSPAFVVALCWISHRDGIPHVLLSSPCHLAQSSTTSETTRTKQDRPTSPAVRPPHPSLPRPTVSNHERWITITMITSGFTNAPVSQFLVFGVVIGALVASLTDTRYYIHIQVVPHIWKYGQFWRFLTWQVR